MELKEMMHLSLLKKGYEENSKDEFLIHMDKLTEHFREFFTNESTVSNIYFHCEAALDYFKNIQSNIIKNMVEDYEKFKDKVDLGTLCDIAASSKSNKNNFN